MPAPRVDVSDPGGAVPTGVSILTMGCARNEVDSEELAGRLSEAGFALLDRPEDAEVVVVNTCGFIEQAKKDSIDEILAAADHKDGGRTKAVVATGCLAERYGVELAEGLPEADAVLGFDHYQQIGQRLREVLDGNAPQAHVPSDRRRLLPLAPAARPAAEVEPPPGHASGPTGLGPSPMRRRLEHSPVAPLKIASGCDRRCTFCAIPFFRGAYSSRRPVDVVAEAGWLAEQGVREVLLVSENTTSYGKDLGDIRLLEQLLVELGRVPGLPRVRLSYLQPAEMRPGLVEAIAGTHGTLPYFDLSFQHASPSVLRRMRRFGSADAFLGLLEQIRAIVPAAGIRSNFIVGFPGETDEDFAILTEFLEAAELDAAGVFAYSDEDGTSAAGLPDKVEEDLVAERVAELTDLVAGLTAARAARRVGEVVEVLVTEAEASLTDSASGSEPADNAGFGGLGSGIAEHQQSDVDGHTALVRPAAGPTPAGHGPATPRHLPAVGSLVRARVVASDGVDLLAEPLAA